MTIFKNHQAFSDKIEPSMRKVTAQLNHICAETGTKITVGMVVYYEDATKKYYCLHTQAVKNFLIDGEDLKANEDISE